MTPQDTPSARYGASMTFDAAMGAVVLFGGRNLSGVSEFANLSSGDTWEYRGGSWTPIYVPGPSPRAYSMMVYDWVLGEIVLFGGKNNATVYNDTWEFRGGAWANVTGLVGTAPSPRYTAATAYDPVASEIVLFGGYGNPPGFLNDTWGFDASGWHSFVLPTNPGKRSDAQMTFDTATGQLLLYGGVNTSGGRWGNVWTFVGGLWSASLPSPPANLVPRSGDVLVGVVEPSGSLLLLFGGSPGSTTAVGDTWVYGANLPLGVTNPLVSRSIAEQLQNVSLNVHAFGGVPPYRYVWTGFPMSCTADANPQRNATFCVMPTGDSSNQDFFLSVNVTDSAGSESTSGVTSLVVVPQPSIKGFQINPSEVSQGSTVEFTVTAVGGAGPLTYSFTGLPPGCPETNRSQWSCQPNSTGVYSVMVTVTDPLGFTNQSSQEPLIVTASSAPRGFTLLEEIVIVVAIVFVMVGVLYWFRRPGRPSRTPRAIPTRGLRRERPKNPAPRVEEELSIVVVTAAGRSPRGRRLARLRRSL